jgi:hypothetical protein
MIFLFSASSVESVIKEVTSGWTMTARNLSYESLRAKTRQYMPLSPRKFRRIHSRSKTQSDNWE